MMVIFIYFELYWPILIVIINFVSCGVQVEILTNFVVALNIFQLAMISPFFTVPRLLAIFFLLSIPDSMYFSHFGQLRDIGIFNEKHVAFVKPLLLVCIIFAKLFLFKPHSKYVGNILLIF